MKRLLGSMTLAVGIVSVWGGVAFAQAAGGSMPQGSAPGMAKMREACGADIQKLCAGIEPGGGRIMKCLMDKKDQASPGCQSVMSSMPHGGMPPAAAPAPKN